MQFKVMRVSLAQGASHHGDMMAVLRIDDTSVKARLRRLSLRNYLLTAMRARLLVESKERERIVLPDSFARAFGEQ